MKKLFASLLVLILLTGCSAPSGEITSITFERGNGSVWGHQFYIELTPSEIVALRYPAPQSHDIVEEAHIPIAREDWEKALLLTEKLSPYLKEYKASFIKLLFRRGITDGTDFKHLTLCYGEDSILYKLPYVDEAFALEEFLTSFTAEDGKQTTHYGEDSPKDILSEDIISFSCEFSAMALAEETPLENYAYTLTAALKGDTVECTYEQYDGLGYNKARSFSTDKKFLEQIQGIVKEYNLAELNGYYNHISGLPADYYTCIDILYASEEHIWAQDNENGILNLEAMIALEELFRNA